MKTLLTFVAASLFAVSTFAQQPIPGLMPAPAATGSAGTDLGANTTSGAAGIDLANRVKLRGYVDFIYGNLQNDHSTDWGLGDDAGFSTSADLDFLLDFSPVTAEIHTELDGDGVGLEQAFVRYNVNRDFSISMGRQLALLGFEADEAPNLYQVSNAYHLTDCSGSNVRRTYNDGIRANFNNARFGFAIGLHNKLNDSTVVGGKENDNTKSGNVAIDLQAAIMILPGLEGRLGYSHESVHGETEVDLGGYGAGGTGSTDDEIERFNAWLAYNDGGLTLAVEYDNMDIVGSDAWNVMLLGSYQFNPLFALTLRYSHEGIENASTGAWTGDLDTDRMTLGLGFTITDNLGLNLEYSHSSVEAGTSDYDVDEIYAEGIMTF